MRRLYSLTFNAPSPHTCLSQVPGMTHLYQYWGPLAYLKSNPLQMLCFPSANPLTKTLGWVREFFTMGETEAWRDSTMSRGTKRGPGVSLAGSFMPKRGIIREWLRAEPPGCWLEMHVRAHSGPTEALPLRVRPRDLNFYQALQIQTRLSSLPPALSLLIPGSCSPALS